MGKTVRDRRGSMQLVVAAQELSIVTGKVGFFETAKYPDGTPVALAAIVSEYGSASQNIPPRSFMRSTAAREGNAWGEAFGKGSKAVIAGRFTAHQVMDAVGQLAAGDIRKTIATIQSPPLKETTIKARMRRYKDKKTQGNLAKPLVDTAVMVNSVTNVVEVKG